MRLTRVLLTTMIGTIAACSGGRPQAGEDTPPVPSVSPSASPSPTPSATARSTWPAWACALGPLVAATEIEPTVPAGTYRAQYRYRRHKFITVERDVKESIEAAADLTLADDGTFHACLGVDEERVSSVGRHASPDKQYHTNRSASRRLLGLRGKWEQASDGVRLIVERMGWKRCDAPEKEMSILQGVQLVCGSLATTAKLPARALACRNLGNLPLIDDLGLDLGSSHRAGPWSMRYDVTHRQADSAAFCGPWLLLGTDPGLSIESSEQRSDAPTVTFTSGSAPLEEGHFLETIDAGVR